MFATTKEMVRIFQVVNLPIPDTNLSFIELLNFLVSSFHYSIWNDPPTTYFIFQWKQKTFSKYVPIMYAIKKWILISKSLGVEFSKNVNCGKYFQMIFYGVPKQATYLPHCLLFMWSRFSTVN